MYIETKPSSRTDSRNTATKVSAYLVRISLTAALAGFIFGFDTVVISGANLPIKELWHTSPWFHGFFIMSMALWGTVVGAIFGGSSHTKVWTEKKCWSGSEFFSQCLQLERRLAPGSLYFFLFSFYWWIRHWSFFSCCSNLYF